MEILTDYLPETKTHQHHLLINGWQNSRQLLHLFLQMVGKIKLALHPKLNHWWHATLIISPVGWTTGLIPYGEECFEIEFNFQSHDVVIKKSEGHFQLFSLFQPSVKAFHDELFNALRVLGIEVKINERPYDLKKTKTDIPFKDNEMPVDYDPVFSHLLWQAYVEADIAFQTFKGRFIGKSSPVQLFWHSFDLALTFFSGKKAPFTPGMNEVTKEAYSHEVISFGFWPGDDHFNEPAYYAYIYPEPKNLDHISLRPREAQWGNSGSGTLALLPLRSLENHHPRTKAVLDFMESFFEGATIKAEWEGEIGKLLPMEKRLAHKNHYTLQ